MNDVEIMMRVATEGKKVFTAEDIREGGILDGLHPNAVGQMFHTLSAKGIIKMVGIVRASRPSRRGGWMFKWSWC